MNKFNKINVRVLRIALVGNDKKCKSDILLNENLTIIAVK